VLEAPDGFFRAFAGDAAGPATRFAIPPESAFAITDCYFKPYPCCRHLQPAAEALMGLVAEHGLKADEIEAVEVATYGIAAEHAHVGWDEFANAQLSFPFIMALAAKFGRIELSHFDEAIRNDPQIAVLCGKLTVRTDPKLDVLYPEFRPAAVTLRTTRGSFEREAREALGSRLVPLDDAGLIAKFRGLVEPVLGAERGEALLALLSEIERLPDVSRLAAAMALPETAS